MPQEEDDDAVARATALIIEAVYGIVALILLLVVIYAFGRVLLTMGIVATIGFIGQCIKAAYDGIIDFETVTRFGFGDVISSIAGTLLSESIHDLLAGAVLTSGCVLVAYFIVNRMANQVSVG
jgi:hypothetical protein